MAYLKFKADQLFDGYHLLENDRVLITDEKGVILDVVTSNEAGENIQVFSGILSPGFINCHCHLELSHLKNLIPPHTGLIDFLCTVVTKRDFPVELIQEGMVQAEKEMYENGIVAVGDIGNTADTAAIKKNSRIRWQSFVEVLGLTDDKAVENFNHYKAIANLLEQATRSSNGENRVSLVPHAPYTISPRTFQLINEATRDQVISIHNQEHPAEDELYKTGQGDYLKLFKIFGIQSSPFPVTGRSSLRSYLPYFNNGQTILLIHNTYMPSEDVEFASEYASENGLKLAYCLCVNANLYIEDRIPPIEEFIQQDCQLVLGTDSYSSNWQLNIAKEIYTIHERLPHLSLENILQWATINGAKALQWDRDLGSFEKGKKPGVVLIENLNNSRRLI